MLCHIDALEVGAPCGVLLLQILHLLLVQAHVVLQEMPDPKACASGEVGDGVGLVEDTPGVLPLVGK